MKLHPRRLTRQETESGFVEDPARRSPNRSRQEGYVLIVMMLFLTLMAISLTAAAPALVQRIRREREIELVHRGKQYARAIRLYYRKFGRYPVRLEDLENTNNIRFLRKRYKDPMTPGGEWRLIHFGEAQLTMPNAGPLMPGASTPGASAAPGFGSPTGAAASSSFASTFSLSSQPAPGQVGTNPGQTAASGQAGTTPSVSADSSQGAQAGQAGSSQGAQAGQAGGQQPGQLGIPAAQLSSPLLGPKFGGGPIVGVASTSKKESIKVLNNKNHYNDWEFVFDPRLDMTMAQQIPGVAGQQNPMAPGVQAPIAQPVISSPNVSGPGMQPMQPTTPIR